MNINIGIIKLNERLNRELMFVRGSKLCVVVDKDMNKDQVLELGKEKHAAHDQFFCYHEDYELLYPDKKVVDTIPGGRKQFTVSAYKQELLKPYSKINLYLCKTYIRSF